MSPVEQLPAGFVLVDKPAGWTSHDVVARLRRRLGQRRIGHAGTLDPMATGLLICAVGRATRLLSQFSGLDKTYLAELRFGVGTVSDDADGAPTQAPGAAGLERADLERVLPQLLGDIEQTPSAVSAVKVAGRRAYALVRAGQTPALSPRPVHIAQLELGPARNSLWQAPAAAAPDDQPAAEPAGPAVAALDVELKVRCSAGTYVRALARDLGALVGRPAHLIALRRLACGPFDLAEADLDAASLAQEGRLALRPPAAVLGRVRPLLPVSDELARRIGHGQAVELELDGPTGLVDQAGRLLAVYAPAPGTGAKAQVVLTTDQDLRAEEPA
ncbi:MAG: tRNA pseudouridine(55) synthase TruB [Propionibacteriaceae bacterium]|nr:tRNA pseudouridine(55) synthase TruB [Propionibacteriaceae bacterium]